MEQLDFYINGSWVKPNGVETLDVINPASEEKVTKISLGTADHVNEAVAAARVAFETYSQTPVEQRIDLLTTIREIYKRRLDDVAEAIQTILRREGVPNPYEMLKDLTRSNEQITADSIASFIDNLAVSAEIKEELRQISPSNYTGI